MRDERIHGGGKSPGWVELAPSADDARVLPRLRRQSPAPVHRPVPRQRRQPQSTLRGMAAMLCGLRYDEDNRFLPRASPHPVGLARWARRGLILSPSGIGMVHT